MFIELKRNLSLRLRSKKERTQPTLYSSRSIPILKKIPKAVLSRCEYGHDDYSLQVENLPQAPPEPGQQALFEEGAEP